MRGLKKAAAAGFTLIELLVVIAIIAILSGVAISQFGGSTASAEAVQCMNNMRNLTMGAISLATGNDWGSLPAAQTYKRQNLNNSPVTYSVARGWIHWVGGDELDKYDNSQLGTFAKANETLEGATETFNDKTQQMEVDVRDVVKRGAVWEASGRSRNAYLCPTCVKERKAKGLPELRWNYVLSKKCGKQNQPYGGDSMSLNSLPGPADKVLLFAEMQLVEAKNPGGGVTFSDAAADSDTAMDTVLDWDQEHIGFNHVQKDGRYVGHVSFADGHVSKMLSPRSGELKQLTRWLCEGKDVTFDGKQYYENQ